MDTNVTINRINEIYELIEEKKLDEAEALVNKLLDNTEKIEIDKLGLVLDFENEFQFNLYCNYKNKKNIKIEWKRSFLSDMYYIKGVIYIDKGLYHDALNQLKLSLRWNPVRVSAYMEILEIQIRLKNWKEFEEYFFEALKVALTPEEISKLYRKYAFFCIESKEYELAYNILKYTSIIYYRKENIDEIKYLSSIAGVELATSPDIGTIEYIRNKNLEYKVNPAIKTTYISIAKSYERLLNEDKKLTKENQLNILKKLISIYTNLYFFDCNGVVHELQINAIQKYLKESKK